MLRGETGEGVGLPKVLGGLPKVLWGLPKVLGGSAQSSAQSVAQSVRAKKYGVAAQSSAPGIFYCKTGKKHVVQEP